MSVLNEHLEHFINQALLENPDLSSAKIEIEANDGTVKLSGVVSSSNRKLLAHQIAESFEGVNYIDNQIRVQLSEDPSDREIADRVNECLRLQRGLSHQAVRVDVLSGIVTISGYTSTEDQRALVADIAMAVGGVRQVENMLMVNANRVLANDEHCNVIRASLRQVAGMEDSELTLTVVDETARISGTVDRLWKKEIAEKIVRRHGILSLRNDVLVQ